MNVSATGTVELSAKECREAVSRYVREALRASVELSGRLTLLPFEEDVGWQIVVNGTVGSLVGATIEMSEEATVVDGSLPA